MLWKKLWRDLIRQRGQSFAVIAVVALGVGLFVASAGSYLDLRDSYASTRARLRLADLHITGATFGSDDVSRTLDLPPVQRAEARFSVDVPATVSEESHSVRFDLRVQSLPNDATQPSLDRLFLLQGNLPSHPDQIVVEKHLAQHHGLVPGATIRLVVGEGVRTVHVVGIAVSAEYLWVSRDASDPMPSPDAFGVGWMQHTEVSALWARTSVHEGLLAGEPDRAPTGNELLVSLAPDAIEASTIAQIRSALPDGARLVVTPARDLVGVRLLQMDVEGYKGMAAFFPLFFLGVAAFIVASIVGRLVESDRMLIGTFIAIGVSRHRILLHYLAYAVALGVAGAVVGAPLGALASKGMTHAYAADLGIPFVTASVHGDLAIEAGALAIAIAVFSGIGAAWRASRLLPAESMRPSSPKQNVLSAVARQVAGPLLIALPLRNVLRRPIRSVGTAVGIAAALILVLTTGAMLDSMRTLFGSLFTQSRRYDLRVDFSEPRSIDAIRADFTALPGVGRIETVLALPVRLRAHDRSVDAIAQGLTDAPTLLRAVDVDGREGRTPAGGLLITRALGHSLRVGIGDSITLEGLEAPTIRSALRVSGFADATIGPVVTLRRDDLAHAFQLEGYATAAVVQTPHDHAAVKDAFAARADVLRVEDAANIRSQFDQLMGLGWVMLTAMLLCSAVLAGAILYNTATIGILERWREYATMRALGRTLREITLAVTFEHALLALLGVAMGIPLAALVARRVLASFSNDIFVLPFVMSASTVSFSAVGIVILLLLAQWPALRRFDRASLASAVRTREG